MALEAGATDPVRVQGRSRRGGTDVASGRRRLVRSPGLGQLATAVVAVALLASATPAGADEGDLRGARRRADRAAADLSAAESRLGALDAEIADLRATRQAARQRADELRAAVQESVVARFMHSDLELAASAAEDPNERAVAGVLADVATGASTEGIDRYLAAIEEIDATTGTLEKRRSEADDAVEALRDRRAEVERELERLQRADVSRSPTGPATAAPIATGAWICPVQGSVAFTNSWGAPRSGGRSHTGVDMLSPRGTPTVAPVAGRLVHKRSDLGGLTWYVYGDDGNTYYGAHLSSYANEGAGRVQGGTVIGYVGDSGNAKGTNHLHFQIKPGGGSPVNPYPTVAKYC